MHLHILKDLRRILSPAALIGTARDIDNYLNGMITQP